MTKRQLQAMLTKQRRLQQQWDTCNGAWIADDKDLPRRNRRGQYVIVHTAYAKPPEVPQRAWNRFVLNNPMRSWDRQSLERSIAEPDGEDVREVKAFLAFKTRYNFA